jgi:outer membrane protein assembly factor BamE (lipoprotein component of BamABCDE complex)
MPRLLVPLLLVMSTSCSTALDRASDAYKRNHDHASLQVIHKYLRSGMTRREVEALLGAPDYSPTDGQYYYQSSERDQTLVVDYRREDEVTDRLQSFDLGTIGE